MNFIAPKEITIEDGEGKPRTFIISKFPAIAGREIVAKYPTSALPKLGEYAVSEETMLKLMAYVQAVMENGNPIALTTRALVDNHVSDWEVLAKIEMAMMKYNCSFFQKETLSASLIEVVEKVMQRIFVMLTPSSEQSSQTAGQPSTNSEPSIL